MSLRDHADMAYAMNSIALHSQFVDNLDEVISILHTPVPFHYVFIFSGSQDIRRYFFYRVSIDYVHNALVLIVIFPCRFA